MRIEKVKLEINCLKDVELKKDFDLKKILCFIFLELIWKSFFESLLLILLACFIDQVIYDLIDEQAPIFNGIISVYAVLICVKLVFLYCEYKNWK